MTDITLYAGTAIFVIMTLYGWVMAYIGFKVAAQKAEKEIQFMENALKTEHKMREFWQHRADSCEKEDKSDV